MRMQELSTTIDAAYIGDIATQRCMNWERYHHPSSLIRPGPCLRIAPCGCRLWHLRRSTEGEVATFRPKPTWAEPAVVRGASGRDTAGTARRAASPGHACNDPAPAPRPHHAPLDSEVTAQIARPTATASHHDPACAADGPRQRTLRIPAHHCGAGRPRHHGGALHRLGNRQKARHRNRLRGTTGHRGRSSCAPRPRRSSRATSSR